jgi:hypothetical protein
MRPNRTVRRPTRWTPDEWRRVEDAAEARSIPPARFVRETVLGACEGGASPARRRECDELVQQLGRVLNNLRQLERAAENERAPELVRLTAFVASATEVAIRAAPTGAAKAGPLLAELTGAGRALNEIARRANVEEALPPDEVFIPAVTAVYRIVQRCRR